MTEKDSSAIALHLQAQSFEGMEEFLPATGCYYNIQEKYPDDYLAAAKLGALNIAALISMKQSKLQKNIAGLTRPMSPLIARMHWHIA